MMEVSSSLQESERRSTSSHRSGEEVSSSSRARKHDVCCEIIRWLTESGHDEVNEPGFSDELQSHFNRLPIRYAMDVNIERAEDVLMHKRLLEMAAIPENRPVFHVRSVQVLPLMLNEEISDAISPKVSASHSAPKLNAHPPPAFGSSPNLEALTLDQNKSTIDDDSNGGNWPSSGYDQRPTHEVTVSSIDKPKLLSQLSSWLADVGLNIREAHAFSTLDGYSLDVFIVDGWKTEDTEDLRAALKNALATIEKRVWSRASPPSQPLPSRGVLLERKSTAPSDGKADWEIDIDQLKLLHKVASGSYGDLFRGTYCGQDVAIKILKPARLNDELQKEFSQEVFIMRKVRHKNVVQFIGACTKPPDLCIVTEFMAGGSVYDYIHKHKSIMKLPMLLRVAIDVSKGMDYLHQNNIIHRDLKAANLLMDENEVVKVADFGVARVQDQSGIMTAETGTYRWMAPEVIEHKPYDNKADIFSFGIVLWELLTGRLPYDFLSPLQAAVAVVQKGLRPTIPKGTHPRLAELLEVCWRANPADRPSFSEITSVLQEIYTEAEEESENDKGKEKKGGFFSALRRTA